MANLTAEKRGKKKAGAAEFCGVKQTADEVVFTIYCPNASVVQLAGSFNNWQPQEMKATTKKDYRQAKLVLEPGRYAYRFVVDGKWQQDYCNSNTEHNPYGEVNSVVVVS